MTANLNDFGEQVLGFPLDEVGCEVTLDSVHKTNRDIDVIAEEPVTETVILIENQSGGNDPGHRNKILDYKQFYEREFKEVRWSLNDHSQNLSYFGPWSQARLLDGFYHFLRDHWTDLPGGRQR